MHVGLRVGITDNDQRMANILSTVRWTEHRRIRAMTIGPSRPDVTAADKQQGERQP
jgi:hypothetical protein